MPLAFLTLDDEASSEIPGNSTITGAIRKSPHPITDEGILLAFDV